MGLLEILHDARFNTFFSFIIGIGLICILRPMCSGGDCSINKPPEEKDFDKYVYRMGNSSCYEFKTEIVACPASGAVEAFKVCPYQSSENREDDAAFRDQFNRRDTIVAHCATISQ
jgi:hypothetical protein